MCVQHAASGSHQQGAAASAPAPTGNARHVYGQQRHTHLHTHLNTHIHIDTLAFAYAVKIVAKVVANTHT